MVECDLAKVEVAGSNPDSRSKFVNLGRPKGTIQETATPFHLRLKRLTCSRYNEV